jgi:cytochrome b561
MGFIIGQKWAKDEAGAQRILLYILIVVVAVTGMILVSGLNFSSPPPPIIPATPGAGAP